MSAQPLETIVDSSKRLSIATGAGIPWRDLPERFGDWKNTHRWAKTGVWERLFGNLAAQADNEYAMIDSTIVRAHSTAPALPKKDEDQALGHSRGGLSTKSMPWWTPSATP
jgi:transposase